MPGFHMIASIVPVTSVVSGNQDDEKRIHIFYAVNVNPQRGLCAEFQGDLALKKRVYYLTKYT